MASPTAAPRNVERAKTFHDLVSGLGARNIEAVGKLANRLNKGVSIDARLSRAKSLSGPFEYWQNRLPRLRRDERAISARP
jgi:hypothetical protein